MLIPPEYHTMQRAMLAARICELCHLSGTFVLRSGETVSGYFDKYQFESQPSLLREVARHLCGVIPSATDILPAPELGGIPLGTAVSLETGLPLVFVHRERKRFGMCRRVEGPSVASKNVLIVDDIVSTGHQALEVGRAITELDGRVLGVVCVIDREHGGSTLGADRAIEIMRDVERRQRSNNSTHVGAVEVIDRNGKISRKRWQYWAEGPPGESKVLVRFSNPPEVRGVGLLTLNHRDRPAEQWLYTPAIKRDRRIATQETSARFMGTDFSNEDMRDPSVEDYEYELLDDNASLGGRPAYKIRAVSKRGDHTQYSYQIVWVRKDIMVSPLTEFYVGRQLRKTLTSDDWEQVQGIWTPRLTEMKDISAGSTTRVRLSDVRYNVTLPDDWFTLRNLRKAA